MIGYPYPSQRIAYPRFKLENLMEQLFADGNTGRAVQAFSPRTTIAETENAYEIQVDLPGILKVMVPKSEAVRPKRIPISSN